MAQTSGIFNLVELTKVEYADADLVAGTVPGAFSTIGTIKEGQLNLDFPEASTTPEYSEQTQQPYRIRIAPVMNKAMVQLVTSEVAEVAKFMGGTFAAGTTGTTPSTLKLSGTNKAANKYVKITGKNTQGKEMVVTIPNGFVTASWSGAMGANQETVGLTVSFNMLQDVTATPTVCIISSAW